MIWPRVLKRLIGGLVALFDRKRAEQELDEELRAYLETAVEQKMAAGMSETDARRTARLEMGGSREAVKDGVRDSGWESFLETIWRDIRYGVRNLKRSPGFALAALATLTLTIGASTAAFTLVNGVLLAPLPFEEPDRLVSLVSASRDDPGARQNTFLSRDAVHYTAAEWRTLEGLAAFTNTAATSYRGYLEGDGPPEPVDFIGVTPGYFELLRVQPVLGRRFDGEPTLDGTAPVLISHEYWQSRWSGDPAVLGQTFRLERLPTMTIIGVLPETFRTPVTAGRPAQVWVAMEALSFPWAVIVEVLGRLRPGETSASAEAELQVFTAGLTEATSASERQVTAIPFLERVVGADARRALLIFSAAVGMLLLIGLLNLVNLQASRIAQRQNELSVRAALGASRARLLRQMIAETMLLTTSGAALGLLMVHLVRDSIWARVPLLLPRMTDIPIDGRVFAFAVALALLSGLFVSVVPALRASRPDVNRMLQEGTSRTTQTRRQRWLRDALTLAQTSLAVVLMVGAGLLIHSFWRLISVDTGFDPENVVTARIALPPRYSDSAARNDLIGRLLETVGALPGVERASVASQLPMENQAFLLTPWLRRDGEQMLVVFPTMASAEFGRVMGLPLLSGRWFTESEVAGSAPVVVVSESLARRLWPGENPLGQQMEGLSGEDLAVVGVVGDIRLWMRDDHRIRLYLPHTRTWNAPLDPQGVSSLMLLAARLTPGASADLHGVILEVEPNSTVTVTSMRDLIGADVARERFQTTILTLFAAAALILATLGVYSVVAFSTAQRTREIGLRVALGARARQVVAQMMREGAIPAVAGLIVGVAASLMLTRFLESYLFEIEPTEPWTYAAVAAVGLIVTLLAAWLPARRAAAVDPMTALRYE